MTSLQQPDLTPTHALPPLFEAWAAWSQDMFSIYSQMLTAQWRFANTTLGAFTPWLEPAVAMTEQIAEQMLEAAQNLTTQGTPPTAQLTNTIQPPPPAHALNAQTGK